MARKILAILTIILGASSSIAYLYYAPSHLALSITDPPPTPYSNNITAIYITLTTIEIHAANAGNNSGWQTLATNVTVNLMTTFSTPKLLGTTQLPPGRYTELRFFSSQAIITISGTNSTYTIPSGTQTGIKVPVSGGGFHIYGGETMTVQLDLSFNNNEIMNNPTMTLTPVATAKVI
ncbi:hypothetical protein AUH73_03145 [archaeon 13_1_40CM_4_53_4]|nr:MAG: hypothetical protein AUI07_08490 [archaeon 13_2_20CM_2_53_6]OLC63098.1 MAG: hypothetical protein AUH73_03145 [archaeon 13_1_40CM_4_53_4]OLE59245.1 MAG: hypothetical protein AUG17_03640 [Crenarchaeota archaeon 13_1_20CM_2_53_14]TMI24663.1 MAG: DUF4382 domain-containing protein [Candidatus Bathyarchaeota archaeon]